ncbi:sodium:proton antiporter [Acidaminobacter sp. JC074]|uniref:cation:proton antiporter domain-containing protein n=1 Tax=Acidaminobacter sp. JC074 TaxID=2530199 RepID=UPI001F0F1777|nr:cation:proton antiporter [Acidaminobacter sp. JC074]MCH4889744.1 sodium:proton antiporter [Acidaminobacter sp. JC074]
MTTSIAIIILLGLLSKYLFEKMKLPGLLGMLLVGILLGPYAFDLLDETILLISKDLRQLALIIILLRAGLGISRDNLNKVGKTAVKMSFIPGILEGLTILFVSTKLFGLSFVEGGILGFIVAAVSPAVVVPSMLTYIEEKKGTNKSIPTLILASASVDDVFAITIYTAFLGLYSGTQNNIGIQLLNIPLSIILGIAIGAVSGLLLVKFFEKHHIRDTKKVLIILGIATLLTSLESWLFGLVPIASLLGVMTIGFIILEKREVVAKRLSVKYNKIWIFAEILLFILIGSQVNIHVAFESGLKGILLIFIGLIARTIGVMIATHGSHLNTKERIFCAISYIPKATVQAAIGAVPLSLGVASGELILAIAVLSIIITAPLGLIGIRWGSNHLIEQELD